MTNYAQNFFGKSLRDLTFDDIASYFAEERSETDLIEYKSFAENQDWNTIIQTICKACCGFLNGNGGILIYGAPRGVIPEGKKEKVFQGDLTPLSNGKEVDWIINKLSTEISPMPKDINIHIIEYEKKRLYIFQIQESTYKPHQWNHVYYIRLDGQSKPAPHFIVQALMREIPFPDVRGYLSVNKNGVYQRRLDAIYFTLKLGIFNFSRLQNEYDINYSILLVNGQFMDSQLNTSKYLNYSMNGALLRFNNPNSTPLYFGMPYTRDFSAVVIDPEKNLEVLLSFGGKHSPAKNSRYQIKIDSSNLSSIKCSIETLEENEFFKEKQSIDETVRFFKEEL